MLSFWNIRISSFRNGWYFGSPINRWCKCRRINASWYGRLLFYDLAAAGYQYTAGCLAVNGDPVADLTVDLAAVLKARASFEYLIDICKDDKDVVDVLRYLREREVVHFQRFGEALNGVQEKLHQKNKFYMNNCNENYNYR